MRYVQCACIESAVLVIRIVLRGCVALSSATVVESIRGSQSWCTINAIVSVAADLLVNVVGAFRDVECLPDANRGLVEMSWTTFRYV
uniref:Putative secreted peptide n=1 Tax=Anopheles braziliensis TaxID=58242 RepID=A0A2M3ZU97_9DIPT